MQHLSGILDESGPDGRRRRKRPARCVTTGRGSHTSHRRTDVTIEVSTTDKRDGKALALFARHGEWQQGHTKDGRPFFAVPGSEPGLFHLADQTDCSCPDRRERGVACKHMRAVRLWMAAYQTGAVAPRPRPATPAVVDDSGLGDELVILTADGARVLTAPGAVASGMAAPTRRYEELFPACEDGCGEVVERAGERCYRCLADETHRADRERKRQLLASL
jgi:hypothetical protein